MTLSRRDFVRISLAAGAGLAAPRIARAASQKTYTTAIVGTGWWGMNILGEALKAGRSKVVAMCDVDTNQLHPAMETVQKLTGDRPKEYHDYREMLDAVRPEIVIVATPDHWHPLVTIAAVNQGAHVYVEKPVGHTIREGRAMINAARANDRVVQVGTHRRVSPHNVSGMKFLKEGRLGKIGMVRAFVHYHGDAGEMIADAEPPAGLDWNMWCGPAPLRPYNPTMHPKGFRQFLDYANGTLGDWGIHWMDQILWWTEEKFPRKVYSTGGQHLRQANDDAPDTQVATFEFESFTATWEHRRYAQNDAEHTNIGCYFYGTEGTFHMGWQDGWTYFPKNKSQGVIHEVPSLHAPDDQNIRELWADFLAAIDGGQRSVCDIEIGHRSTNMSLLAMLSLKAGRSIEWDGDKEVILHDPEANKLLRREYRAPWEYPEV